MCSDYFVELFMVVGAEDNVEETYQTYQRYQTYIKQCFKYLLKQNDDYIVLTIKKNESLTSFFLSYFSKKNKFYDLISVVSKENTSNTKARERNKSANEKNDVTNDTNDTNEEARDRKDKDDEKSNEEIFEYNEIDVLIFEFYERIVNIYIENGAKNTVTEIKSVFLDMSTLMDVIMTFSEVEKKRIKMLLKDIYEYDSFHILQIGTYIRGLYEELKNIEIAINECRREDELSCFDEDDILFRLNEFLFCVYCFMKFFKKYYVFHGNKGFLTNELITVKLFVCLQENQTNGISSDESHHLKNEKSFLNIFVQVYVQMINALYLKENEEVQQKQIMYLRYRLVKILNMFIKQVLLYGDKKVSSIYLSYLIDTLKETKNKINIQILRNDIQLHNWEFLDKMVLEDTLNFDFYSYINDLLQIRSKHQEMCLLKQKYEKEIAQIKEVTNVKNEKVLITFLKKANFNVTNCANNIFALTDEVIEALEKDMDTQPTAEENEEEDDNEEDNEETEEVDDEETEEKDDEDSGDEDSGDEYSEDEYSEDEGSEDEGSEDEGSDEEESDEEESDEEDSSEEEGKGEIIQLDEVDIINGNVDYIPDVISILKEKERNKKKYKKKKDKKNNKDIIKEEEKQKIKEKIIHLLDRSVSSQDASDYIEDDFQNDLIFPVVYSKDIVEEMERMAEEYHMSGMGRSRIKAQNDEVVDDDDEQKEEENEEKDEEEVGEEASLKCRAQEQIRKKEQIIQAIYPRQNYNVHNGKGTNKMQNNFKKYIDNNHGRNRHNSSLTNYRKLNFKNPDYDKPSYNRSNHNKSDYNRQNYNKPYYNRLNYNRIDNNRKRESTEEQTVEQNLNIMSAETDAHNASSRFRGNRKFNTSKGNDEYNEADKNVDKEREKRQYARKRMNAGKNYRKALE